MRSLLHLALVALPLFNAVAVAEDPSDNSGSIYANAHEAFQDLLNALPDESLQAALTSLTKFKAGVFESHRHGVERVHNDNPPLATKLIVEAVRDLTRRQQPANGTSAEPPAGSQTVDSPQSSPPPIVDPSQSPPASTNNPPPTSNNPPPTSNAPPPSSNAPPQTSNAPTSAPQSNPPPQDSTPAAPTSRPVIIPIVATTTDREGRTLISTTSVLSAVTASVRVTVTRTNDVGATVTAAEFKPAVIRTVTDSQGRASAVTSAANFAPTKGEVMTTTDEKGSTFLTTYTPDGGRISSLKLITTTSTDAEGRRSTFTSYAYVDPTADATNGGSQPSSTNTGPPRLQTAAADRVRGAQYAMAGGVLGVWAVFF